MIQSNLIFDVFFKKLDLVNKQLKLYLDEPNEEHIHNIRTSIRRLETAYSIISKSSKTKTSEKLIKYFKDFFSFNSKIRDYDIILEKLIDYGYDLESEPVLILQKKKLQRLVKAIQIAKKLSNVKKPKIKQNKKITSKFEKRILSLISDFNKFIPVVISNESNVEELHSMRKTVKKLRYVLELEPNNSYQNIISNLKQLQTLLGYIHDCDIFIWYVQKIKNDDDRISNILDLEKTKRNKIYKNLVLALSDFNSVKN